jgi:hypothetical protein
MRLITLTILFFIPLFGFASFPIQTTSPNDTIIESKKETMEEYNIRIQKQLYNSEDFNFSKGNKLETFPIVNNRLRKHIELIVLILGIITFRIGSKQEYPGLLGSPLHVLGIIIIIIGLIIFVFKQINNRIKKIKLKRNHSL